MPSEYSKAVVDYLRAQNKDNCDYCQAALDAFENTLVSTAHYYGTHNLTTGNECTGIVIRPDRNAHGNITHFHFELIEEISS